MSQDSVADPLILLVEDNETIRDAFSILLEESGYRVAGAGSGGEAIRLAGERNPDLVLLDLGLPDVDGYNVARAIRSAPKTRDIPIVALTGRAQASDREACREAGCDGFLVKPVDTRELLRVLPGFIAGRSDPQ